MIVEKVMDKELDERLTAIENQLSRIERMVTKRFFNSGDAQQQQREVENSFYSGPKKAQQ